MAADGYPANGLVRPEVVSLLRGPASSPIVLTISRQGLTHNRAVYLERRTMTQPPLKEVCIFCSDPFLNIFCQDAENNTPPEHTLVIMCSPKSLHLLLIAM